MVVSVELSLLFPTGLTAKLCGKSVCVVAIYIVVVYARVSLLFRIMFSLLKGILRRWIACGQIIVRRSYTACVRRIIGGERKAYNLLDNKEEQIGALTRCMYKNVRHWLSKDSKLDEVMYNIYMQ